MSSRGNLAFEINSMRRISDLELAGISTSSKFAIPVRILTDVQVKIPRTALDPNAAASRAFCTYVLEYHGISSDLQYGSDTESGTKSSADASVPAGGPRLAAAVFLVD
ncbi:unnamed protein product [Sphagnum compactum]